MPLTPFHFGPALLVGLLLFSYIDFPTFLVANVILDIEPILVLAFNLGYTLHGFFHSLIGGTIVALVLSIVMRKVGKTFSRILSFFRLEQKTSFRNILSASLLGVYLHIFLDSRMHWDIQPFYPLEANPFLDHSELAGLWLHMVLFWCFFGAAVVYALRLFIVWRRQKHVNQS